MVPGNPYKPNEYQWEALSDEQAKNIITPWIRKYTMDQKILGNTTIKKNKIKVRFLTSTSVNLHANITLVNRTIE
jgi:hypothetical protein